MNRAGSDTSSEPSADSIVFRIKNIAMIDAMKAMDIPSESMPAGWTLVGDLIVTFGFDLPGMFRVVSRADVERLGLDGGGMYAAAMKNLQVHLSSVNIADLKTAYSIEAGGDYEACLLLVPGFWVDAQKMVNGDVIVAVPHRSRLLFTGSADDGAVKALHVAAAMIHDESQDNHALSRNLYIFKDNEFQLYRTAEEAGF